MVSIARAASDAAGPATHRHFCFPWADSLTIVQESCTEERMVSRKGEAFLSWSCIYSGRQNKLNTDSKGFLETKSRSEGFLQTESRFMSFLANKIAIFKGFSRRNRPWTINFCNSDFVSIDPFES